MSIGFVVWNPFQVFHMGPIADQLDDATFVVLDRAGPDKLRSDFGGSVSSFINRQHQVVTPQQLTGLDGKLDAFVCPNPFPGMNSLVASRRVGIQYSMTKESYQYGAWRSQFDINLAYGDYTVGKLLRYGPAVAVGNPRFAPWFNGSQEALAPSKRKTVVYLPTWGEFSSVPAFLPAIEALQEEYDVIVKLHHKIHLTEPDKTAQLASSGIENVFLPHDDLLPLLRKADLVISDFSGAIFDAIYVRKPVLLLQEDPDSLVGKKFTFDSIEYARREAIGPVVSAPSELSGAVAAMLDGSLDYREPNERLRAECFAEDVHAAERSAEVLETFSRHRRNPQSPTSRSIRPKLTDLEPVEQLVQRMEQSLDGSKGGAIAKPPKSGAKASPRGATKATGSSQPAVKRRLHAVVKATGSAVGAPAFLPKLVAGRGPWGAAARRKMARIALRLSDDPVVAVSTLDALRKRGQLDIGQHLLLLADLHFTTGNGEEAARLVESLSDATEGAPDQLKLLAQIYRTVSGPAAIWGAITGLASPTPTPVATGAQLVVGVDEIVDVQDQVMQNAAAIAASHTEFDLAAAVYDELNKVNDDVPELHYRHGRALTQAFRFDEARHAYAETLRRSPFTERYLRSFTTSCSRAELWVEGRRSSLGTGGNLPFDISAEFGSGERQRLAFDMLDSAFQDPSVVTSPSFLQAAADAVPVASLRRADYWIALHWRLIRDGAFSAAYKVKDLAAWSLLNNASVKKLNDTRGTIRLAQALTTLGDIGKARQLLSLQLATSAQGDAAAAASVSKVLADLDFLEGDASSIVRWAKSGQTSGFEQDEAHETARKVFADRRVAIIGPGRPAENVSDDRFDSYDVVVRPNLFLDEATARATGSRRTDVAYFNSGFTRLGLESLLSVAGDQALRQVVLRRPRDLGLLAPRLRDGTVRFIDIESSCHLFASSFGVQRMVYDISRYGPESIDVFNVDFFAGSVEYVAGYKIENADVSFRGFSHDFRGDFIMSQNLRATGAVKFDSVANSVLDMDVADYLALLDAKAAE